MLGTLIKKEVTETILDLRFVIATLLFVVLIPLGMYVSRKNYEERLADYQLKHRIYQQQYGKDVSFDVKAHGFRPPSVLSIFALGFEHFIPDRVITARSGVFSTAKDAGASNSPSLLFGQLDLLFNMCFVISLAALIFTFNSICGEKETGTLRLIVANSVPRGQILLSKIIGNYVCLLIPFIISLLIALIILELSPVVSIFSTKLCSSLLAILLITFAFIFAMVSLGVLVSTLTQKSIISMTISLFAWVIFTLALPKATPMIARIAYPLESQETITMRKQSVLESIQKEFEQKSVEIHSKYRHIPEELIVKYFALKHSLSTNPNPLIREETITVVPLDRELIALDQERKKRIANGIKKIERDYENKRNIQNSIAMNLSRISPVSCYTYLVSGLSNTGVTEFDKFMENAERYQDEVADTIYDNYQTRFFKKEDSSGTQITTLFDSEKASIPDIHYEYTSLAEALQSGWVDILLLFLFNILFFVAAFLRFRKYDVR